MSGSLVLFKKNNHIAKITLNHPSDGNTINVQMSQALSAVCQEANEDDTIYVVVITGSGNCFSKGNKLEQSRSKQKSLDRDIALICRAADAVGSIDKPVIAMINGDAVGQGLEIALACDIRLASSSAHFAFPDVSKGIIPADGGTQRLARIVGKGKALELILTAEIIDAIEAEKIGLVAKVVAPNLLPAEVDTLAAALSAKAPIALRYIKEAVNKGTDMTLEQGLRLEADLYFLLHTTSDRTEGIKAFQQKRAPKFTGH